MRVSPATREYIAALGAAVALLTASLVAAETIPVWQSYPDDHSVEASLDRSVLADGKPSVRLNLNSGDTSERVSFFQTVKADAYLNRTLRITARVRTADFKGQMALAGATYDETPYLYIYSQRVKNAGRVREWQTVELMFAVPSKVSSLSFGLLFKGATGSAWLADVQFSTVDGCRTQCATAVRSGRLTHAEQTRQQDELKITTAFPQNLDFSTK
jgi:hypothetical protein